MAFRRILVPVDFSQHSRTTLEKAVELVSALGAELHVMHAAEVLTYRGVRYTEILTPDAMKGEREAVAAKLEEWHREIVGDGVPSESHLVEGDPRDAIPRLAREIEADLIMMGSHGHGRLHRALIGSVAEHTLREADCAVLVIREQ